MMFSALKKPYAFLFCQKCVSSKQSLWTAKKEKARRKIFGPIYSLNQDNSADAFLNL